MPAHRDIDLPARGYPTLDEGQIFLGIEDRELCEIYVFYLSLAALSVIFYHLILIPMSLQEHSKVVVRDHRVSFPLRKRQRYGERLENSAALVLPLEERFPVLKRCKENWGAKWILRKASSAVSMMDGQISRRKSGALWNVAQPPAVTATALVSEASAASAASAANFVSFVVHAPANTNGEGANPKRMYPRTITRKDNYMNLRHGGNEIDIANAKELEAKELEAFTRAGWEAKAKSEAKAKAQLEGDGWLFRNGHYVKAPIANAKELDTRAKQIDAVVEAKAKIEDTGRLGRAPFMQPGYCSLANWNLPTTTRKYAYIDDSDACAALFEASKSWLVSESRRF